MSAFLLALAVTGAAAALTVAFRDHRTVETEQYGRARDLVQELHSNYVDQEAGVRGYVISADELFLRPYEAGVEAAERNGRQLRELLADDEAALDLLDAIESRADQWQEEVARPEIAAIRAGNREEAAALVATGKGQRLFDQVRADIKMLVDDIREHESDVADQLGQARRRINIALAASLAAGVLLLWAVSRALQRWVARPLAEISSAMRDVTDGDLNRRIPAVGPKDVAALGEDAELMRRRIVAELDSARRAEQALRSQGAIVSVLREELGPSQQELPPSLSMAAGFEPVMGVLAGDWYDVLVLDDGAVALCLIDVSGHGQSTGVFALQAKNLMLAGARQLLSPGAVLEWMARALGDTGDNFLTCFFARIDPEDGTCDYASAGHLPALVAQDHAVMELGPTGPLLGPLPGQWTTERVKLAPAGQLIVYTDGVTEARGPDNEEFGDDRLRAVVAARAGEHPTSVIATCLDAVHDFAHGDANDDLTIVAVRWLPHDTTS